jgi:subtilase family serine protease
LINKEVAVHAKGLTALFMSAAASVAVMVAGSATASAEPLHYLVPHAFAQPPTTAECESDFGIACYNPNQLENAYGMPLLYRAGLTGAGQTIAIVDSFGSPTIQSDLATFDSETGLPAPPSFTIIQPDGAVPPYDPNDADSVGWAEESSLDVEYAHAMAPGANILLVETPVDETEGITGLPQMMAAENYVINNRLAGVITQSFGATEQTFTGAAQIVALHNSAYLNAEAHDVTVLAASGDAGATDYELNGLDFFPYRAIDWPSSDPLVTSVGGTQLHLNAFGARTAPDNVWNDQALFGSPASGGGGQSTVFSRPSYQNSVWNVVGASRGTPDLSMSAAVDGGANVYLGFTSVSQGISPGWYIIGGTSEASPLFSGIVAIADQAAHHWLGLINPTLYLFGDQSPFAGITDITSGNNSVTFTNSDNVTYTVNGFNAVRGYDMASGLGTANGPFLVAELALSRAPFW